MPNLSRVAAFFALFVAILAVLFAGILAEAAAGAGLSVPSIAATAKGPDQINLAWGPVENPGYGYIVEIQSAADSRYSAWTELKPIPPAAGYPGDPTGQHVYNPPINGIAPWVTEPQYVDPQDGTPAQFIAAGLKPATTYRFRTRTYFWNTSPVYGAYSNVVAATTAAYTLRYVSTTGDDSGDGSTKPWKTLAHASASLACGQVLMVAGGTYAADQVVMSQQCAASQKAVVLVNPGETAILTAPAGAVNAVTLSGNNLVVDGLAVRTVTPDYEVLVGGVQNAVLNLETANGWGVHLVHASQCLVYHSYLRDAGGVDNGGGGFVLAVEASSRNIVWSNHLTRGSHDVSLCKASCTGSRWLNNVMDGGWGMGWEAIEQSTGNLVEGNVIWHVQQLMGTTYKPGIEISSAGNTVRRNLLIGGKSTAVEVSALYGGDTAQGVRVYNNTIVNHFACLFQSGNDGGGLGDAAYDGFEFRDNICVGFQTKATDIYRTNIFSGIVGNDIFSGDPGARVIILGHSQSGSYQYPRALADAESLYSPPFSRNLAVAPRFNDLSAGDYHLHPLSPVLDKGAFGKLPE